MTIPTENKDVKHEATQQASDNAKEQNFAHLRRMLEQEKAARLAAEEKAAQLERAKSTIAPQDDEEYDSEPYVDHRKLERKLKRFESSLEEKIEKKAEEKARALLEQERQQNYLRENRDFDEVMREEHVQKFADKFPSLAQGFLKISDPFERQRLVYENIKALGLHKKEQPSIQGKIDENQRKGFYHPSGIATPPGHHGTLGKNYNESEMKNEYEKIQQLKKNLRLG